MRETPPVVAPAPPPAPRPEPLLSLQGLHKRFGQVVVADGLDLEVARGEALGIVGPNGAGKSSLFAMISGDLRPDAGAVRYHGIDVTGQGPHVRVRAGMGRTYQIPRPFAGMTVFENVLVGVREGAGVKGRTAWTRSVEVLEQVGLSHLANTPAGQLGLLARKRLEVARALGTGPDLLLLDEVAGGLTEPEVAELVAVVRALHAQGLAIVWIEHVVHALVATVEQMVCLAGGTVLASGAPADVLADATVREVYLGRGPEADVVEEAS